MSAIIKKKINNTIYVYEVKYIKSKHKHKWKCLGKLDDDGVLISRKRNLPAKIVAVKRVSKEYIIRQEKSGSEQERQERKVSAQKDSLSICSDIFACHQPLKKASQNQSEAKICVVHKNRENIIGLIDTIKRLKDNNNSDYWVSISEFRSEKLNENYITSMQDKDKKIILEYCREREIPTPRLIVHDGNNYMLKWILIEPLNDNHSLKLWKTIQKFLAGRFFCLLDDRYYLDDKNSPKQEVSVTFNSVITYTTSEIAVKLHLLTSEIEQYRKNLRPRRKNSHMNLKLWPNLSLLTRL